MILMVERVFQKAQVKVSDYHISHTCLTFWIFGLVFDAIFQRYMIITTWNGVPLVWVIIIEGSHS